MKFAGSFSPDMYDIMQEEGRAKLLAFAENVLNAAENGAATSKAFAKPDYNMRKYTPGAAGGAADASGRRCLYSLTEPIQMIILLQ